MQGTDNIIRGKVMASPKSKPWWILWIRGSSTHQKCFNYKLTNLLFGLCMSMWIIDPLVIRPSPHPRTPTHPSTPKVLQAKEHAPTLYPFVVFTFYSWIYPNIWECVTNGPLQQYHWHGFNCFFYFFFLIDSYQWNGSHIFLSKCLKCNYGEWASTPMQLCFTCKVYTKC